MTEVAVTETSDFRIESRGELVSLLHEAAELEHGLVCSYLFTAFTLRDVKDEGLTAEQAEAVTRWRSEIISVALEEMLHLALVSNLLTSVGASPHFERPAFPQRSRYYPAGITIELRAFSDATITRFVHLERPEGVGIEEEVRSDPTIDLDAETPEAAPGALRTVREEAEEVATDSFDTVGHLYEAIEDGFCHLVERLGERTVFIGPPLAQATSDAFGFPDLMAVTDLVSARRALGVLVSQGEGVRGDWEDAHYGTFLRVRDELRSLLGADPDFEPAHPALANPLAHAVVDAASDRLVDDPLATAVMNLFDGCYGVTTALLARSFVHTDESDDALAVLIGTAIDLMQGCVAPLGDLLTGLPAGQAHPRATAGPSFGLHTAFAPIPHRQAAWLVLHERLVELSSFARRLVDEGGPEPLAEVAATLVDLARGLEAHLDRPPLQAA